MYSRRISNRLVGKNRRAWLYRKVLRAAAGSQLRRWRRLLGIGVSTRDCLSRLTFQVAWSRKAFRRTFRIVRMFRLIAGGSAKCFSSFDGVSHIAGYLDGEGYQTLVGSIMEMIAATVFGSCWPKAPSSV